MSSISRRDLHSSRALDAQVLPPSAEALGRYLSERGYAPQTIAGYVATAAHFLRWSERSSLPCAPIDESAVARFLDRHIGHCDCGWRRSEDHHGARAALGHLLLVLRTLGMAPARTVITTPVDEEIRGFEEHLDHVRGLAPKTRQTMGRIVRELLWKRFHDRPVVISVITPEHLRRCFASLCERYRAPI